MWQYFTESFLNVKKWRELLEFLFCHKSFFFPYLFYLNNLLYDAYERKEKLNVSIVITMLISSRKNATIKNINLNVN